MPPLVARRPRKRASCFSPVFKLQGKISGDWPVVRSRRAPAGCAERRRIEWTSSEIRSVGPGAVHFLLRRSFGSLLGDDLPHSTVGLNAAPRFQASRELEQDDVRTRVDLGANRVGEPPLLADLIEEPRTRRAAEERRVDR